MEIEASVRLAKGVGAGLQRLGLAGLEVAPGEGKAKQVGQDGAVFALRHAGALGSSS